MATKYQSEIIQFLTDNIEEAEYIFLYDEPIDNLFRVRLRDFMNKARYKIGYSATGDPWTMHYNIKKIFNQMGEELKKTSRIQATNISNQAITITSIEQLPAGLSFLSTQLAELNEKLDARISPDLVPSEEKLFTREQTAERLKVSLPTLNEYTKDGLIAANRFGRRILYKESDIQAALRKIQTSSK